MSYELWVLRIFSAESILHTINIGAECFTGGVFPSPQSFLCLATSGRILCELLGGGEEWSYLPLGIGLAVILGLLRLAEWGSFLLAWVVLGTPPPVFLWGLLSATLLTTSSHSESWTKKEGSTWKSASSNQTFLLCLRCLSATLGLVSTLPGMTPLSTLVLINLSNEFATWCVEAYLFPWSLPSSWSQSIDLYILLEFLLGCRTCRVPSQERYLVFKKRKRKEGEDARGGVEGPGWARWWHRGRGFLGRGPQTYLILDKGTGQARVGFDPSLLGVVWCYIASLRLIPLHGTRHPPSLSGSKGSGGGGIEERSDFSLWSVLPVETVRTCRVEDTSSSSSSRQATCPCTDSEWVCCPPYDTSSPETEEVKFMVPTRFPFRRLVLGTLSRFSYLHP